MHCRKVLTSFQYERSKWCYNSYMEIIFGLLVIIVLFGLLAFAYYLDKLNRGEWEKTVAKELKVMSKRYNEKDEHTMRSLVIEADKLLDYCFKNRNLRGESMGDRLKNAKNLFGKSHYNEIWQAHKVRNKLAHEVGTDITMKHLRLSYRTLTNACKRMIS